MANKLWVFKNHKRKSHWKDDSLVKLERISWILSPSATIADVDPTLWVSSENDSESWDVQIFRSIDSGSVTVFPRHAHYEENQHLIFRKNVAIDNSIHTAYVRAIRSAQHFIYIENQYFIGSSYGWPDHKSPGADSLIPMELALKIAIKIRAGEQFAVYVVMPMWPEGEIDSSSIKQILYFQGQTMKMMYNIVGDAIKSMKLEKAHPQDYLNFYCLGKKEERLPNQQPQAMNQPSEKNKAASVVYGYRMSLWAEHLGILQPCFKSPQSLACIQAVNKIADENWVIYIKKRMIPLQGHLIKYPIKVDVSGEVGLLDDHECFPGTGIKILGEYVTKLLDELTM